MDYRTIAPQSWIYLSFQDDNHLNLKQDISQYGWIYLSFQDDNHLFVFHKDVAVVGYTFHFKMITTCQRQNTGSPIVGYTFHFKMITTSYKDALEQQQLDIPFISR